MRVKREEVRISIDHTLRFFDERAKKYNDSNPYSVTMYQDDHPELVKQRNQREIELIKPKLDLSKRSKILDVGCGIGRWADAIKGEEIELYCGIDFSEELVKLANERNINKRYAFFQGGCTEITNVIHEQGYSGFNRVLVMGVLIYLNDDEVIECLNQIEKVSEKDVIVCIREPIGIEDRLTLKDYYSNELKADYSAIYRTNQELMRCFDSCFISKGLNLVETGGMYKKELNNRAETEQHYYLFKR